MMQALTDWFLNISGATVFLAHSICLTNDPVIMSLYVVGDLTTWASYMVIGGSLLWNRGHSLRMSQSALALYGTFIFLCGLSHLSKTLMLFAGMYRLDVFVVAAMAAVSAMTAVFTLKEVYAAKAKPAVTV